MSEIPGSRSDGLARRFADPIDHLVTDGKQPYVRLRERDGRRWISIRSEFAMVELSIDVDANGARVSLRDADTGEGISLDPLELEALTRMEHQDFGPLIVR